jgi:hypothetical protein
VPLLFRSDAVGAHMDAACLPTTSSGSPPPRLTDGSIRDRAAVSPAVASLLLSDKGSRASAGGRAHRAGNLDRPRTARGAPDRRDRRVATAVARCEGAAGMKAGSGPQQPAVRVSRCPRVPGAGALADALGCAVSEAGVIDRAVDACGCGESRGPRDIYSGARGSVLFLSPRGTRARLCKPAVGTNETWIRECC